MTSVLIWTAFLMFKSMLYSQTSTIIPLKELDNPQYLIANKDFLLIEDNQKVRMYAMKDFKLVKTIGRKGEGPGEFRYFAYPQILSDSIMISSAYKVAFFDFSGNLIKEQKTRITHSLVRKINNKYVSFSVKCLIFNLEGKQLKRTFIPLRDTSPINTPPFTIYNNHLYQLIENFDEEQWQLVIDPIPMAPYGCRRQKLN
jgi:hypothetical protein